MVEPNLFGVTAKPKARKAKAAPGEVQVVIGKWAALFEARFREKPLVTGKDGAAVKRLIAHAGAETVLRRLPIYLDLPDEFLAGQGYPLSLMLGQWNRLVALDRGSTARGPAADADSTSDRMARLKSQGRP